jgi:hypothetical protein
MDFVREQIVTWHQTAKITRTHPDTRVYREDLSGPLPPRAHVRHPQRALPKRDRKKGYDEATLEMTRGKHDLRRLYNRKNKSDEAMRIFALDLDNIREWF